MAYNSLSKELAGQTNFVQLLGQTAYCEGTPESGGGQRVHTAPCHRELWGSLHRDPSADPCRFLVVGSSPRDFSYQNWPKLGGRLLPRRLSAWRAPCMTLAYDPNPKGLDFRCSLGLLC